MAPLTIEPLRILDFDIENRPLSYYGGDLTTAEVTVIAWSWADRDHVEVRYIDGSPGSRIHMLFFFRETYNEADIVTGHFIRKHDLPIINGAMVEAGLPPLGPKPTIDTKLDLIKWNFQAQPKSQEELALTLGIESPKVRMTQHDWREANRLTPGGVALARERCVADVEQHKALRLELTRRGLLRGPKTWSP